MSEINKAGKDWSSAQPPSKDQDLDSKRHDRSYNPIDEAQRGTVSDKLNDDAGKMRRPVPDRNAV